jgi:AraC-like DNA-binding protein
MNMKQEDLEKASMIKAILEKEFYKHFTIPDLVQLVGTNKKTLNTAFKYLTGKSIIMYQREIRIEKAKELLVETDHTIERIASKVGLDRSNLEKQFKKLTDKTPREWRIESRNSYTPLLFYKSSYSPQKSSWAPQRVA